MALEIKGQITEDQKQVTLEFLAPVQLNAEGLSELISQLAELRGTMQPEIQREHPLGKIRVTIDPAYWVAPDQMYGGTVLSLRHQELGWLHFSIPQSERETMIRLLSDHHQAVDARTGSHQ